MTHTASTQKNIGNLIKSPHLESPEREIMPTLTAPLELPKGYSRTRPKTGTTLYHQILNTVRDAGLLKKNPKFYIILLTALTIINVLLAGLFIASAIIFGTSWLQMLWLIPLVTVWSIITAQYGFVAHEAAHKQVFEKAKTNEIFGIILANLFAGMSYGFWLNKHNRHHAKPNQLGADPDINLPVLSFTKEQVDARWWGEKILTRLQGKIFIFLLMFTGFTFIWDSVNSLIKPQRYVKHRWTEASLFIIRQAAPLVLFFTLFNPLQAAILYMSFMMIFGIFIGGAFAPNHKGMPLLKEGTKLDFFGRQVLLSRNIKPSKIKDFLMGGLNYQVEHHLFPSMPRTSLNRAHSLVKEFCKKQEVPFTIVGLFESYSIIIKYFDDIGLQKGNIDPFVCPIIAEYRARM